MGKPLLWWPICIHVQISGGSCQAIIFKTLFYFRAHFKAELEAKAAASTSLLQSEKEEQEWASLMVENEMWNRETGAIRSVSQCTGLPDVVLPKIDRG